MNHRQQPDLFAKPPLDSIRRDQHRLPPHQPGDTSRQAAESTKHLAAGRRGEVLAYLQRVGRATIEQIAEGTKIKESTVCGRISELRNDPNPDGNCIVLGERRLWPWPPAIRDSGERAETESRCSAILWEVVR